MTVAEEFIEVFRPHTGRYVEKDPVNGYRLKRAELTPEIIEAHLKGERVISFLTRVTRNVVGMDIDDHQSGGWVGGEPTVRLAAMYHEVVRLMKKQPSGVFKSNHGVHAYWLLATSVPDKTMIEVLREKFGELLTDEDMRIAEVLPTNSAGLKIPRPERYLDAELRTAIFPGFRTLVVYPVEAIFGDALEPDTLRYRRAGRRASARKAASKPKGKTKTRPGVVGAAEETSGTIAEEAQPVKTLTIADVEKVEQECGPFKNGQGNPQYLRLIRAYRRAGISQGEAVDRLKGILARSLGYIGDVRTGLEGRVAASYRRLKGPAEGIGLEIAVLRRDRHAMAFVTMVIDDLGMKNAQERAAAERFLLRLWAWKVYLDGKMKRPEEAWAWDFENPRFRKMMAEGYYPLPSKLLRKWRHDYNKLTNGLKALRVIVESPYNYSTDLGYCKHYALNLRQMQRTGSTLVIAGTLTITKTK
jgi:hypothetical protein